MKEICLEIEKRDAVHFLEIETDNDDVPFMIKSVPKKSASEIVRMIKRLSVQEVLKKHLEVKEKLWGSEFWRSEKHLEICLRLRD
jgi:REP element-mobilizing transposase RayT